MQENKYIEASPLVRIALIVCVVIYVIAITIVLSGSNGDTLLFAKNVATGWRRISLWAIYLLMSALAIYLTYLAALSFRHKVFPASNALLPVRTRQIQTPLSNVISIALILAALGLVSMQFAWSNKLNRTQELIERLNEHGVDPFLENPEQRE